MAYCPKCGNKVDDDASFCPKCGASLKSGQPQYSAGPLTYSYEREEKNEKREKQEKNEKQETSEKSEQGQYRYLGPIIGGVVLIILGLTFFYPQIMQREIWAVLLASLGVLIIVGAIYAAMKASKSNPKP
jgi:uncharacterized membrane protein YvbJ